MSDTISVLVVHADLTKGIFGDGVLMPVNISVEKLRTGLSDLVAKLKAATADIAANVEGLALKELEVGIEITAEGGVSLIGTAKAGATASLKMTFARDL